MLSDMRINALETVLVWAVRIGLFLIPFLPLFVSPAMLFPFITGKNFAFRIATEALFVAWLWLAIANPAWRPRLTLLFKAVTVFVGIVFFADLLGANPYRSFFSNYERMEGFMMIGHLYLYYLMLSTVFRRSHWMIFFHATLASSMMVSWVGLLQKLGYRLSLQGGFRVDSTIGNPTYLAAYLLFHVWIILILMYAFRKKWWALALYGIALSFELAILYFTATRGAILALAAVGVALAVSAVIWWGRIGDSFPTRVSDRDMPRRDSWPLTRKIAAGVCVAVILVPLTFWSLRSTEFVESNQVLRRLTNYSFTEGTIQARFMIWGMSLQGFLERPILGWGQENYYLIFQKYYDPGLYGDEPWFDRSHNVLFDWLIHAGILGLASYLSMIAIAVLGLARVTFLNQQNGKTHGNEIKSMGLAPLPAALKNPQNKQHLRVALFSDDIKSGDRQVTGFSFWHGLILIGMFAAYLLQNIFVFDNLNTYLLFFAMLAYSGYLIWGGSEEEAKRVVPQRIPRPRAWALASAGAAGVLVVLLVAGTSLHIKPIRQSAALIGVLRTYQENTGADKLMNAFHEALAYDSFGTTEVREQLANIALTVPAKENMSEEEKKRFVAFAIEELEKETAGDAKDVKHLLFAGSILNRALALDPGYPAKAEKVLVEAVDISPVKQPIVFELAQLYALAGQFDRAVEILHPAWKGAPDYRDAGVHLWVLAVVGKNREIQEEVKSVLWERLGEPDLFRLGETYRRVEDYAGALPVYEKLVEISPTNAKYRATLAALFAHAGRNDEARHQAREAARLDPSFEGEAAAFLQSL